MNGQQTNKQTWKSVIKLDVETRNGCWYFVVSGKEKMFHENELNNNRQKIAIKYKQNTRRWTVMSQQT